MSETFISQVLRLKVTELGGRLFRNMVGGCEIDGRHIRYGLAEGSPDTVGWMPVTITQEMVGKKIAAFIGFEIKVPGHRTNADRLTRQKAFIKAINDAGGIAAIVESPEEALQCLTKFSPSR